MAGNVVTLTSETFHEAVKGAQTPVLVDLWAEWCGPCKQIAPILEQIAVEKAGLLTIAKVDTDAHPDIAQEFSVMSIPTLLLFVDGELVHRMVGAKPKSALERELEEFLPSSR